MASTNWGNKKDRDAHWRRPEARSRPSWSYAWGPTNCVRRVLTPFPKKTATPIPESPVYFSSIFELKTFIHTSLSMQIRPLR